MFCRREGASDEHVFAQWISKVVPGEGGFVHTSDDPHHKTHTAKIIDIKNRASCEDCNHGWMNDLEMRVEPIILGPIRGESCVFTAFDQIALASWAFKTATMLDCSWRGRVVPKQHYRYVYRYRIPPPSVHIWVTYYAPGEGEEFHSAWAQRVGLNLESPSLGRRHGYRMTFSVGHMVFQLFGYDGREELNVERVIEGAPVPLLDVVRPLWPIVRLPLEWPPPNGFTGASLLIFGQ